MNLNCISDKSSDYFFLSFITQLINHYQINHSMTSIDKLSMIYITTPDSKS